MSFFNNAVSSAVIATGVAFMIATSGSVNAAPGTNLTAGDACTVKSGPNKGKTGTYGSDGWCEGDWGGTECGSTKCKIVAKATGGVNARTTAPARTKGASRLKLKRSSTFGSKLFSASR